MRISPVHFWNHWSPNSLIYTHISLLPANPMKTFQNQEIWHRAQWIWSSKDVCSILFSSAKSSVITAVQTDVSSDKAQSLLPCTGTSGCLSCRKAKLSSRSPCGRNSLSLTLIYGFFSNGVSLWCYNCTLTWNEFTLFKKIQTKQSRLVFAALLDDDFALKAGCNIWGIK